MRSINLIAQISLDGYVAGPKGEFNNFIGDEENLAFVCSLTENADAALLGRKSFQLLDTDWPTAAVKPGATKHEIQYSNWYNTIEKYVLSETLEPDSSNATIINKDIATTIAQLKQKAGKDILMFGSPTALHHLLELDLVDSFWIILHPVLFGEGIPLFRDRKHVTKLNLQTTKQLQSGTLVLNYELKK
jgi:dihydrofolate reductase